MRHLKALQLHNNPVSPYIHDIVHSVLEAFNRGANGIHFMWIPGHSSIKWNEKADKLASLAYKKDLNPFQPMIPLSALRGMSKRRTKFNLDRICVTMFGIVA